jgi:hypothetical protein
MRRPISAAAFAATFVLVAAAGASAAALTTTLTNSGTVHLPTCPGNPCSVISRTTALQVKDGNVREPFTVTRSGSIVAWSVTLATPDKAQTHYFDLNEGGTARAGIAVLRLVNGLTYKLVAQSPIVHLEPFFGENALTTLAHPIPVVRGDIIALTVPTWLPALSVGYSDATSWRAARSTAQCTNFKTSTVQTAVGSKRSFDCLYQESELNYSATERSP